MNTITVVSAHGQGMAAYQRHFQYWDADGTGNGLIVISPENDPVLCTQGYRCETVWHGKAEHNGRESWKRFQRIIESLKDRNWDWCVMHEYDSFCLDPKLPEHPGFYGNLWENRESPKYMAPRYANPPWTFDHDSFDKMAAVAAKYPGIYENGEADRYWSALAFMANVPILPYDPPGFSRGLIDEKKKTIQALRKAIYAGAYAIHGVKSKWALAAVEEFWDQRPKNDQTAIQNLP